MITCKDIFNLRNCSFINFDKIFDRKFSGVSIDSRNINSKEIFIAIKGENTDGHKYISTVFGKKVTFAIVNENWYSINKNNYKGKAFVVVEDTTLALGQLAKEFKKNFAIPVLCVGGSNGKTSTKDLIYSVLSQKYNVLKTEGNFNNHIGLPLTLMKLNKKNNFCLLEVGSNHFNEINYLCDIAEPDFGLVTNVGKEHLEFFKNLNGVAKEEFTLYDYIRKEKDGTCFFNLDDNYIRNYAKRVNISNRFSYSYNQSSNVNGKFLGYNRNFEPVIEVSYNKKSFRTKIPTFGKHSIYNGIAAATIGLFFGLSTRQITKGLSGYKPANTKRMEISKSKNVIIVNDTYNSNPDSVRLGLETIKEHNTKGKKHIVLSDMLEMGESSEKVHSEVGKLVKNMKFENLYTFGDMSYNIFKKADGVKNNFYFDSKAELSDFLKLVVKEGDIIYIKGSRGMKMEEVVDAFTN
jgi:UDP-N-acetylmuramoyl-tripeptide--D-alanyl-D-alanine ligase